MRLSGCRSGGCVAAIFLAAASAQAGSTAGFNYNRDTLSFANTTVFEYHNGEVVSRWSRKSDRYTRRCFVMTRTVEQFYKFARFDPNAPPLQHARQSEDVARVIVDQQHGSSDEVLVGAVEPLQHALLLGRKLGDDAVQKQSGLVEQTLGRGEFFIAYLSYYPILHINHSVLVYKHDRPRSADGTDHYLVYDPNHPDAPRHLEWLPQKREFSYEKDKEFAGGFTRVFQVYGKLLQ